MFLSFWMFSHGFHSKSLILTILQILYQFVKISFEVNCPILSIIRVVRFGPVFMLCRSGLCAFGYNGVGDIWEQIRSITARKKTEVPMYKMDKNKAYLYRKVTIARGTSSVKHFPFKEK